VKEEMPLRIVRVDRTGANMAKEKRKRLKIEVEEDEKTYFHTY